MAFIESFTTITTTWIYRIPNVIHQSKMRNLYSVIFMQLVRCHLISGKSYSDI